MTSNEKLYGFSPFSPPAGTVEAGITELLVPSGREEKHPRWLKRGYGVHIDDIDGYQTDRFGRPIPKLSKEQVFEARKNRVCPAYPYCFEVPFKCFFACQRHWFMIPAPIRSNIWLRSRPNPDMVKLKEAVREGVYWLHYALGPSITPSKIADRAICILHRSTGASEVVDIDDSCVLDERDNASYGLIRRCIEQACEDAESVSHAKHAEEIFQRTWKERLEYIWY